MTLSKLSFWKGVVGSARLTKLLAKKQLILPLKNFMQVCLKFYQCFCYAKKHNKKPTETTNKISNKTSLL